MVESKSPRTESWLERPATWLIAVAVVALLGFGYWLMPKRTTDIASLDGQHRWSAEEAPLRRQIIWQPAEPVDPLGAEVGAGDSLIRPFLADDGNTLYFALRKGEGGADIYRSRKGNRQWQPAEPVEVLNSEADDFGPVIRADGKELFLYSNREGGHGEFDLYVSALTDSGWSTPRNLGPYINSPADEYDPAITPDGARLFFESNRSPRMQQLVNSGKLAEGPDPWQGTLRVEKGLNHFDLYEARRPQPADGEASEARWKDVTPLAGLNRKDSNEGAPYVDSAGIFLYFVSDRPQREGEDTNYDIYRARIAGDTVGIAENLGPGVNTVASEIEPALSRSGFELFFSRSELEEGESLTSAEQYALYRSDAIEIEEVESWDDGNLKALMAFLAANWWWIVLLLLLAALLAAIIWALRSFNWRRIRIPVFLLIALLVHFMLFGGSFYVYFGDEIIQLIKKQFQEELVVEAPSSEMNQSNKPGQESYEKQADIDVEAVKPSEIARQDVTSPNVPVPTDTVIPRIPSKIVPDKAPKLTEALPTVEVQTNENIKLVRHDQVQPEDEAEMVELETTEAPAEKQVRPQETVEVDLQRVQPPTQVAQASKPLDLPPRKETQPAEFEPLEAVKIEDAAANPARPTEPTQLPRSDTAPAEAAESLEVPTEQIAAAPAAESAAPFDPSRAKVAFQRQETPDAPSQLAAPTELAFNTSRPATEAAESLERGEEGIDQSVPNSGVVPATIDRSNTARGAVDAVESEQVPTEAIAASSSPQAAAAQPASVNVQLAKQSQTPGARTVFKPIAADTRSSRPATAAVAESLERVEEGFDQPVPSAGVVPADIDRSNAARGAVDAIETEQVPTEAIAASSSPQAGEAQPASVNVQLAKQSKTGARTVFKPIAPGAASARPSTLAAAADVNAQDAASDDVARPKSNVVAAGLAARQFESAVEAIETAQVDAPVGPSADATNKSAARSKIAGVEINLERTASQLPTLPAESLGPIGGPNDPRRSDLQVAGLADKVVDGQLAFGPVKTELELPVASAPETDYAFDAINLQTLLVRRQIAPAEKAELVKKFGGTDETLEAVRRGLSWIEMHQHEDGHWAFDKYTERCRHDNKKKCKGKGKSADAGATGFALLPFLGDGHTHKSGEHQQAVGKAINWLVKHQKPDGDLWSGGDANSRMYSHGIASIALCEAYGMSEDPALREPAQRAINFIVNAQGNSGGWRYKPRDPGGDTSVLGWQVMALKSAQMAGLYVPDQVLKRAEKWLDGVAGQGGNLGQFGYTNRNDVKPAMTAEALLCLEYMGVRRDDPRLVKGGNYLLKHVPKQGQGTSYGWYYGTQVMYHLQGDYWKKWEEPMRKTLVGTQIREGNMTGTWDPRDQWENSGGRIFSTSLRVLMLEVYYRHLPLYQPIKAE